MSSTYDVRPVELPLVVTITSPIREVFSWSLGVGASSKSSTSVKSMCVSVTCPARKKIKPFPNQVWEFFARYPSVTSDWPQPISSRNVSVYARVVHYVTTNECDCSPSASAPFDQQCELCDRRFGSHDGSRSTAPLVILPELDVDRSTASPSIEAVTASAVASPSFRRLTRTSFVLRDRTPSLVIVASRSCDVPSNNDVGLCFPTSRSFSLPKSIPA